MQFERGLPRTFHPICFACQFFRVETWPNCVSLEILIINLNNKSTMNLTSFFWACELKGMVFRKRMQISNNAKEDLKIWTKWQPNFFWISRVWQEVTKLTNTDSNFRQKSRFPCTRFFSESRTLHGRISSNVTSLPRWSSFKLRLRFLETNP